MIYQAAAGASGSYEMPDSINAVATHYLPSFITAPGETDVLMVVTAIILGLSILAFGLLFLRLHTLPERLAHKSQKIQFEIVAVLGLLALFTHIHAFWVAGLLLALIDFPDVGSFLGRIAGSVEKIAEVRPPLEESSEAQSPDVVAGGKRASQPAGVASETHDRSAKGEGPSTSAMKPARKKEASHA
jgi:multisubunit Na+/H+ antiporter MnhF subunit